MKFNPLKLENKKILITGASSGIGRATAIYISKLGAKVVLTGRNEVHLKETMEQLEGEGHSYVAFDLTNLNNIEIIFEAAIKDGVKLNGMVHSAGIPFVMPLRTLTPEAMQNCFTNDYFCFVELVRQYSKSKYSDGGSIIAISSITSEKPVIGELGYCTAKSALNSAVECMAVELAKKRIRVNGILAGNILTEMVEKTLLQFGNKELKDKQVQESLIGRWGTPDDIAAACAFLLSDMSAFTTASLLDCSGGLR